MVDGKWIKCFVAAVAVAGQQGNDMHVSNVCAGTGKRYMANGKQHCLAATTTTTTTITTAAAAKQRNKTQRTKWTISLSTSDQCVHVSFILSSRVPTFSKSSCMSAIKFSFLFNYSRFENKRCSNYYCLN